MQSNLKKILFLCSFASLLTIEVVFCFTPLGSIPVGPIVATLAMIPVIITAIMLGTAAGAAMGAIAGLFSFIVFSFITPAPTAFLFTPLIEPGNGWSLVICFVPRILVGVVSGLSYRFFSTRKGKAWRHPAVMYGVSSVLGSLTNTFLVLGGIWLFFGPEYAAVNGTTFGLLAGVMGLVVLTNGIPEAIVSFLAGVGVCTPMKKLLAKGGF